MHFSADYQAIGRFLIAKFDKQNKEKAEKEEKAKEQAKTAKKKRVAETEEKSAKKIKSTSAASDNSSSGEAPSDHPIYGLQGPLHHIIRSIDAGKPSYYVAPDYNSRPFKVYGANNFVVGSFWIFRIAALRDGAHGLYLTSSF
jgi:outer membrane biosynthesis protein TonB